eukprot:1829338-Prorocentrum_lima.AAC.1
MIFPGLTFVPAAGAPLLVECPNPFPAAGAPLPELYPDPFPAAGAPLPESKPVSYTHLTLPTICSV